MRSDRIKTRFEKVWEMVSLGYLDKEITRNMDLEPHDVRNAVFQLRIAHRCKNRIELALLYHGIDVRRNAK